MPALLPCSDEYADYLRDESRSQGRADTIAFPESEDEVREILRALYAQGTPVTVQGARTGLAAGAVPQGGCALNLMRMNRFLGMRRDDAGRFFVRVQPGVMLLDLRQALRSRKLPTEGWDEGSRAAYRSFVDAPLHTFPADPTEASASIGGMAACNASGAHSYRYGATRPHISAVRMALSDGDVIALRRGEAFADGRLLALRTEGGRAIEARIPSYRMPHAKCASGYFAADGMDAIDAVIGSDGTLGVITELELELMPSPQAAWDVTCFFPDEESALRFVLAARDGVKNAAAIEYVDQAALDLVRDRKAKEGSLSDVPEPPRNAACMVFVELACEDDEAAMAELESLVGILEEAGGNADATWVAGTESEREGQRALRHAVPESANRLIDERRREHPGITKLGSDMSVPPERLMDAVALYRTTLACEGLQSATWGHIGDAHLHVNILPRNDEEYARGKALFAEWAHEITRMGGAVSAEHGVGKLKRDFLAIMYGEEAIREMARFKLAFDPKGQLGRGNFFSEGLLDSLKA